METLANLESFVRSAETGGFSAAARRLSLTPAAVSRNVAMLERNLGVRLFQRSTRKLTLTEAGERFLHAIRDNLDELQAVDCERRDGSRRTGRRAQGQHGHDLRGRIHPAAAAGIPETLSECPRRLAVRKPAGRSDCGRFRRGDRRRHRAGAGLGVARACARCTSSRSRRRPISRDARRPPIRPGSPRSTASSCAHRRHGRVRERPMRNAAGEEMAVPLKSHHRVRRSGSDVPGGGARPGRDARSPWPTRCRIWRAARSCGWCRNGMPTRGRSRSTTPAAR